MEAGRIAAACALAREMVDTPAADMGPLQMETIAREIAEAHGASISVVTGDALLEENYPAIHAVGRAAAPHRAPRIIEIGWNLDHADRPLIALVGKGVAFDSGGLDIKSAAGMRNMKKDMGGAAHVLALARLVVEAKLKLRLQVLVPAVENSISGNALRPLDIIRSKAGKSVEIGHTDAEGRLILADAFARAGEEKPELMLDFATLTGAARVALGPDLPALFANDDALSAALLAAGIANDDPAWRMPLWKPYRSRIDSKTADMNNVSDGPFGGAIIAALFLQDFVPENTAWAHFDVVAWSPWPRPGRPEGAMMQGLRAVFAVLKDRYAPQAL
jgi:leucyl aminopeptidase